MSLDSEPSSAEYNVNAESIENEELARKIFDVRKIFTINPELGRIAHEFADPDVENSAELLFLNFLEANFPNHEHGIAWHGSSSEKMEGEIRMNERDSGWFGNGFYVTAYQDYGLRWGRNLHPMLVPKGKYAELKSTKFKIEYFGDSEIANVESGGTDAWVENEKLYSQKFTEKLKEMGNIGVKVEMDGYKDAEVVIFDPSKIHVIGSGDDVEKFKRILSISLL